MLHSVAAKAAKESAKVEAAALRLEQEAEAKSEKLRRQWRRTR